MAIGAGAAGAWAATNATTHTVTLPAHASGNLLIVIAACKAATMTNLDVQITTPASGWTRVGNYANGTTASGNGTGSVRQAIFYKEATSSSETNPVVTWGGGETANPGIAVGLCFTKAVSPEGWVAPVVVSANTNAATSISVTMGSNPGITSGDWGLITHTTADDSALTVPTWSATSATLGTVAVYPATPIASATGFDMAGTSAYRAVTAGTASAAPVVTGTQAAAEGGVTSFVRLRVVPTDTGPAEVAAATGAANNASGRASINALAGAGTGTALNATATTAAASAYATAVLALSPVAYWKLDETSGTNADDSAGSSDATYTGGYTQNAGAILPGAPGSVDLNGSTGYLTAADNAALDLGDNFTISALIDLDSPSTFQYILNKGTAAYAVAVTASKIQLIIVGDQVVAESSTTVSLGPHHLVVTKNGSAIKIWLDGVDSTTLLTNAAGANNATDLLIGTFGPSEDPLGGRLSHVALFNSALNSTQVASLFEAALPGLYAKAIHRLTPKAYWRLGESSGTTAVAVIGPNGTYVNTPTLGAVGALAGDSDTAVTFDGTDDRMDVTSSAAILFGNGPVSIAVWLKRASLTSGFYYFLSKGAGSPSLYLDGATGEVEYFSYASGAGAISTVDILDTNWHFIVGTKDTSNNWKVYIDGADVTSVIANTATYSAAGTLLIGDDISNDAFPGSLDEIAFFASVLTPTQISDLYAVGAGAVAATEGNPHFIGAGFYG